jgi:Contact-dependent growth inhibition CdiA C-terminal domain
MDGEKILKESAKLAADEGISKLNATGIVPCPNKGQPQNVQAVVPIPVNEMKGEAVISPEIPLTRIKPSLKPDETRLPKGKPKEINPKDKDPNNIRGTNGENQAAEVLAKNGYDVEKLPDSVKGKVPGIKKPDFKIEGEVFDSYTPAETTKARSVAAVLAGKLLDPKTGAKQADRFVVNLMESNLTFEELTEQFTKYPLEGLKEILLIKDGKVIHFFPFDK